MSKIETISVETGSRNAPTNIYQVDVLPLPTRGRGLTPMLATNGAMQIALPNRSIISVDVDGSAHMLDSDNGPILDFDSIKTGTLHASQILTVGNAAGWRVELSGVNADYPIKYWDGTDIKFSLDKNGNVSISGSITASEIHIPSTAAPGFHVDTSGNVWWNSTTLAGASHYVKEDGVAKFKSITLETSVIIKDLQAGSVIAGTYIDELEANKITAGTGIINALSVKALLTMGDASNDGIIASYNWDDAVPGFYLKGGVTPIFKIIGGTIIAGTIKTASSGKRVELNTTGNTNEVAFYNADDTLSGKIYGAGTEVQGGPWIFLTAKTLINNSLVLTGDLTVRGGDITLDDAALTLTWIHKDTGPVIKVNQNFIPYTSGAGNPFGTPDLGLSTAKWGNLYLSGNIIIDGTVDGINISSHASNASAHHSKTTSLDIANITINGDKDWNNKSITNCYTVVLTHYPTTDNQAATKKYVDDNAGAFVCSDLSSCNLTSLGTRQHAGLTNITADQHHNRSHDHSNASDDSHLCPSYLSINVTSQAARLVIAGGAHIYGAVDIKTRSASLAWIGEATLIPNSSGGFYVLLSLKDLGSYTDGAQNCGTSSHRWNQVWATNGTIQTSTKKEKKNIKSIEYGMETLDKLRPVNFQWKKNNEKKIGLIGEEVLKIIPEVVYQNGRGINYSELVPVLINAIRELNSRLKKVENI